MLVERRDAERAEDDDEDEDVVDREGLLDEVSGRELDGAIGAEPHVDRAARQGGEEHPNDAPCGGFLEPDDVRLPVEEAEIHEEHERDEREEAGPERGGTDGLKGHGALLGERDRWRSARSAPHDQVAPRCRLAPGAKAG